MWSTFWDTLKSSFLTSPPCFFSSMQLRSRSSPVRSAGTSPQESTMESSPVKAARWAESNALVSNLTLTELFYRTFASHSQCLYFVFLCVFRVSSVAASRTMPCTLVPVRGTAWLTEPIVTAASTAAYRNVWLWAWAEMVKKKIHAKTMHFIHLTNFLSL